MEEMGSISGAGPGLLIPLNMGFQKRAKRSVEAVIKAL